MIHPALVFVASLPLIFRLVAFVVPDQWLEPYAYWSAAQLNTRSEGDDLKPRWRNVGWWQETDDFSQAGEALARRLLAFAEAEPGGNFFDIGHGAGESLPLHLSTALPPTYLTALTSLSSETRAAQELINNRFSDLDTRIEWFTGSATYRPGKDLDHPLNPMRGYLGKRSLPQPTSDLDNAESDLDMEDEHASNLPLLPSHFDFVYILDAIYHFPPSVPYFLASVFPTLRPGVGIIAYTDILPPPNLNAFVGHLILPTALGVPTRNLMQRPKTLEEYAYLVRRIGFEDIVVEDWTDGQEG
ncbi:MAG: hypothetical protein TREMPRED_004828 [Tremellales sp. Tagirdzhanova-0007]|nr:MAG: hypothetical protein TREMPRED_004828 [Tremellales sp. Tagirdzhanova-0007]